MSESSIDAIKIAKAIQKDELSILRGKEFKMSDKIKKRKRMKKSNKGKMTLAKLSVTVNDLSTTVNDLSTTVNDLSTTVNDLSTTVNDLAKQINARLDNLERGIDTRFDILTNDVNSLKQDVKNINARLDNVEKRLDYNGLKKLPESSK